MRASTSRIASAGLALVLGLVFSGCDGDDAIVERWLTCIECIDGEREAVRQLGGDVVPRLTHAVYGPTAPEMAGIEQRARGAYARIGGAAVPESVYVGRAVSNFRAVYQQRAALSLGDIGTAEALQAIEDAIAFDSIARDTSASGLGFYRPRVRQLLHNSLALARHAPFGGAITPSPIGFGDTIVVRRDSSLGLGGASVELPGAPFGDRLGIRAWGDDSVALIAGVRSGEYALLVEPPPAAGRSAAVPLHVRSFSYATHDAVTAPNVTDLDFPQVRFLALGTAGVEDTIDYFRFEARDTLTLRVVADWRDPGELDLRWFRCPQRGLPPVLLPVVPPDRRPEESSVVIPGGSCAMLAVVGEPSASSLIARLEMEEVARTPNIMLLAP